MSKCIKKLLADIQSLAIEINTKTKHDVFVNYSGHINTIEVVVHYEGWHSGSCGNDLLRLSLGWDDEKLKKLKNCKRELQKLLRGV